MFDAIARARPLGLFLVAGGPRDASDAAKCQAARASVESIDWDCVVARDYADTNLGAGERPANGLSWVFSQVEQAIILDDDCLPGESFFPFCQELLRVYADNPRVMEIGGANYQFRRFRTRESYFFSKCPSIHGWATWRRAWQFFDRELTLWREHRWDTIDTRWLPSRAERIYWSDIFDRIVTRRLTTFWDYEWAFARWRQGGLSAVPDVNLISNIGYGPHATHTRQMEDTAGMPIVDLWRIRHPSAVTQHVEADEYLFRTAFRGDCYNPPLGWLRPIAARWRYRLGLEGRRA